MTEAPVPRQRSPRSSVAPYAMVTHGVDRRMLTLGQELTIGRGIGVGIRIAHEPTDVSTTDFCAMHTANTSAERHAHARHRSVHHEGRVVSFPAP